MLVDDSAVIRRLLCTILAEDGEIVVSAQARNGVKALEALTRSVPDIVVRQASSSPDPRDRSWEKPTTR